MSATLLIEIGVEELPPGAMRPLMDAFADTIVAGLDDAGLVFGAVSRYATPRRLAVAITDTAAKTPPRTIKKTGPAIAIAYDAEGQPTAAAEGFARAVGVPLAELITLDSDKGPRLAYQDEQPGEPLAALLPAVVEQALRQLPIARRMRWGSSSAEFVRPVHWVVSMHGTQLLPLTVFGIAAGTETHGHRLHHPAPIALATADDYVERLRAPGHVLADPDERQARIHSQLLACAETLGGNVLVDAALLAEVNALVEWPVALGGRFDERYLQLPREVLLATLQGHQRYFAVADAAGELCNAFITVANIDSSDPAQVIAGNERVVHPRLADALFFWEQDRSTGLAAFADGLDRVSFQQELGTLADKVQRVQALAAWLAEHTGHGAAAAPLQQAATLAKADLLTHMVDEFPELQGIMGCYYAQAAGMDAAVAQAIGEHYAPVAANSPIAGSLLGRLLSLADHLDTLAGIFAIGKRPSGDKDPFALRRAALGVLRTLIEGELRLDLRAAIAHTLRLQPVTEATARADELADELFAFHLERLRGYYAEQGYAPAEFAAVAATGTRDMLDFEQRLRAVASFTELAHAAIVCGAHKRARNLLKKNGQADQLSINPELFSDQHEQQLNHALAQQQQQFAPAIAAHDYPLALASLAELAQPLDAFFEHVMVMVDDPGIRNNRLALLAALDQRCRQVADISLLTVTAD